MVGHGSFHACYVSTQPFLGHNRDLRPYVRSHGRPKTSVQSLHFNSGLSSRIREVVLHSTPRSRHCLHPDRTPSHLLLLILYEEVSYKLFRKVSPEVLTLHLSQACLGSLGATILLFVSSVSSAPLFRPRSQVVRLTTGGCGAVSLVLSSR